MGVGVGCVCVCVCVTWTKLAKCQILHTINTVFCYFFSHFRLMIVCSSWKLKSRTLRIHNFDIFKPQTTVKWTDSHKMKKKAQKQRKSFLPFAVVNSQWAILSFYYIVILKCMKDFIFCKITAVYYLCFKCKKTITVIPSCSWTMKKKLKDAYIFGIYYSLKT